MCTKEELKEVVVKEIAPLSQRRAVFLAVIILIGLMVQFVSFQKSQVLQAEAEGLKQIMTYEVEQSFRNQARFDLVQGRDCIKRIMGSKYLKDETFDNRLFFAVDTCMNKERTTSSGDSFMIDLTTKEIKYDTSLDCFTEGGKVFYNRKETASVNKRIGLGEDLQVPVCNLHHDEEACFIAQGKLLLGYDSKYQDDVWFNFDGSPEWLEFIVIPEEEIGFDKVRRGGSKQPHQYLLVLGIQSDEVWRQFILSNQHIDEFVQQARDYTPIKWAVNSLILVCLLYALYIGHIDKRAFLRIRDADK